MSLSVVIPTYNRPKELLECLASLAKQTQPPAEVMVIDDAELSPELLSSAFELCKKSGINFVYHKKNHATERQGLSESKNLALDLISQEIICFLDDDLVLEPKFLESIGNIWTEMTSYSLLGVAGVISNARKKSGFEKLFNGIFGLDSKFSWDVNDAGFQIWDDTITKPEIGHYAHGGLSSYNKQLLKNLGGFEVFAGGRTGLEDVALALKAKHRNLELIVTPQARAWHKGEHSEGGFEIGLKESQNRKYIFKKYCPQTLNHQLWFAWTNIGWILRQILAGHFTKASGMISGLFN